MRMAALRSERWRSGQALISSGQRSDAPPPAKLRVSGDPLLLPGAPDGIAALLLPAVVQFFRKACRTSSRGRLFRFRYNPLVELRRQSRLPCSTNSPDFDDRGYADYRLGGGKRSARDRRSGSGRIRSLSPRDYSGTLVVFVAMGVAARWAGRHSAGLERVRSWRR